MKHTSIYILGSLKGLFLEDFDVDLRKKLVSWTSDPLESIPFSQLRQAEIVKEKLNFHSDLVIFEAFKSQTDGVLHLKAKISNIPWT